MLVQSYKYLAKNDITEENLRIARVLGWCMEFVSSCMSTIALETLLQPYGLAIILGDNH